MTLLNTCLHAQVYYSNGCQIIPPHDSGIAAAIEQNLPLWGLPTFDEFGGGLNPMGGRGLLYDPLVEVSWNYFNVLTEHLCFRGAANQDSAPVVYTPLHGVGLRAVQHAFQVSLMVLHLAGKAVKELSWMYTLVIWVLSACCCALVSSMLVA